MSRLLAIILVVFLVFARPVRGFFGTADVMAAVAVATAGAALAAVLVAIVVLTTRRRRAAAGGCVTCQFQCQHAMTGPRARSWLVSTVDRGQASPSGSVPAHPATRGPGPRTLLPIQPVAHAPAGVPAHAVASGHVRVPIQAVAPRTVPASVQHVAPAPVRVPIQAVAPRTVRDNDFEDLERVPAGPVPRWPDRPLHRAAT